MHNHYICYVKLNQWHICEAMDCGSERVRCNFLIKLNGLLDRFYILYHSLFILTYYLQYYWLKSQIDNVNKIVEIVNNCKNYTECTRSHISNLTRYSYFLMFYIIYMIIYLVRPYRPVKRLIRPKGQANYFHKSQFFFSYFSRQFLKLYAFHLLLTGFKL